MYCNCSGPGFSLHSEIVMPYISHYGSKAQIEHYIPQMTAGKCIGAISNSAQSFVPCRPGVKTFAKKDGTDWILNGSKVFITNGWMSDVVIVVAVTNREAKTAAHGISLFLVDSGTKGFQKGRKLEKLGLKAQDTAELFFEDVRLPAEALLGQANKGFYYLMNELPQVQERIQVVQHKLAELKTEVCVGRAFIDSCLQLHSEKKLDSSTASMAKYWATDLQNSVATQCLQLHGGWGYMWEYPIAKVSSPTNENGHVISKEFLLKQKENFTLSVLRERDCYVFIQIFVFSRTLFT
uniref:Acyl-CoA dehydrogenase long chain n=1 Tax=Sinocyclocheilus grahami TaxID=75366 RepID=A0A672K1N2_SINGR